MVIIMGEGKRSEMDEGIAHAAFSLLTCWRVSGIYQGVSTDLLNDLTCVQGIALALMPFPLLCNLPMAAV